MESCEKDYNELYDVLKGNTSMMFSETANAPAKAITEFLKKNKNSDKPLFKGAYVEESIYSADQLEILETSLLLGPEKSSKFLLSIKKSLSGLRMVNFLQWIWQEFSIVSQIQN